jgi:hypothetical protein
MINVKNALNLHSIKFQRSCYFLLHGCVCVHVHEG